MTRWLLAVCFTALVGAGSIVGCSDGEGGGSCDLSGTACPTTAPSYATDVAPLMTKYCTSCHSPSGSEPGKPLDTYGGINSISGQVQSQIESCAMPPSGDTQPTDAERQIILGWLACGGANN